MYSEIQSKISKIVEIARYAPSVHNTQPWRVSVSNKTIAIKLDPAHTLDDGDPTGRETMISMGIFTEALILAAANMGVALKILEQKSDIVELSVSGGKPKEFDSLESLMKARCTDRSIYKHVEIDETVSDNIKNAWKSKNATTHVITDADNIDKIADLTAKGIGVAMSSPSFRRELSNYLLQPWSKKKRGISVKTLHVPWLVAVMQPFLVRAGLEIFPETNLEKRRWESASAVVAITTPGDLKDDWFNAGRAYMRVSLEIEKTGLAQATSAATVEASNYHEDVEDMLNTKERLQCMIRIGKGSKKNHYSPRIESKEILVT